MSRPNFLRDAPQIVVFLCRRYDAWILGSRALPDPKPHSDWDLMIPWSRWPDAAPFITKYGLYEIRPNSFGGWKLQQRDQSVFIDVWPDRLERLVMQPSFKAAYHPTSNTWICPC